MSTIALSCNHCGAPLEIPHEMRFLTCSHCGSRLGVKHSGSAVYTSVLERIEKQTEEIAGRVQTLELQNELERLDREWEMERRNFMTVDKHGRESEPSAIAGLVSGLAIIGFGLIWIVGIASNGGNGIVAIIGVALIALGIFLMFSTYKESNLYAQCRTRYEERRNGLVNRIEQRTS